MKQILFFILIPFLSYGQVIEIQEDETGDYSYQEIMESERATIDQIYKSAKKWIAVNYQACDLELEGEEGKQIIFKAFVDTGCQDDSNCRLEYSVILDIKESKIRLTVTNFNYSSYESGQTSFSQKILFKKVLIKLANKRLQVPVQKLRKEIASLNKSESSDW